MDLSRSYQGPQTRAQKRKEQVEGTCVPLSRVIEQLDPSDVQDGLFCALQTLLYLLRFGSETSPYQRRAVVHKLDRTQKCVLALLEEWWTRPHDSILPEIKQCFFDFALAKAPDLVTLRHRATVLQKLAGDADAMFIQDAAEKARKYLSSNCKNEPTTPGPLPFMREALNRLRKYMVSDTANEHEPLRPAERPDYYHECLMNLYFGDLIPSTMPSNLRTVRFKAATEAAYERIAHYSLIHTGIIVANNWNNFSGKDIYEQPRFEEYIRCISSSINRCPWLECEEDPDSWPRYLLDIRLGRTVPTAELPKEDLRYAVISHTWGRWRAGAAMEDVRGVPWRIPRITQYDVLELPQMLEKVGFAEAYVWMDLLCIPQDMSDPSQLAICKAELPRQLHIFQNASTAVIWLADVNSWNNTKQAIAWAGIDYLHHCPGRLFKYKSPCNLEMSLRDVAILASTACDLVTETVDQGQDGSKYRPAAWFTSLWTLQEMLIRPDMFLLDRHWRPLALGNTLAVTLDNLVSVIPEPYSLGDRPKGIWTMMRMFYDQGIHQTTSTASRIAPIVCGIHRQSTSPRAQAIMSVMGATDWFKGRSIEQFQSPEQMESLMSGLYPFDFVTEVRQVCGAAFFMGQLKTATLVMNASNTANPAPGYPLRDTMLPFSLAHRDITIGQLNLYQEQHIPDHPSVQSWLVHPDGSVSLPSVAIIASTSIKLPRLFSTECLLWTNDPENITSANIIFKKMAPHLWLHKFDGEVHAICTQLSNTRMKGIIIHRLDGWVSYVKIGTLDIGLPYTVRSRPNPPVNLKPIDTMKVDWHVL